MKKRFTVFILVGSMALTACGCGSREEGKVNKIINFESVENTESATEAEDIKKDTVQESEPSEVKGESSAEIIEDKEELFDFANIKNLEFCFSSGAGGWATIMMIKADGSFSGQFFDGDLGVTGDGYPNGTMFLCNFTGQFTQPVKVNEYTYSMQILELNYAEEVGKEEIKDGMLYCYTDIYGLEEAEDILIYLPGAPLTELPEEFRSWVGYYDLSYTTDTELPFYALNNEALQYGFSSYDIVDNLKANLTYIEDWAASIEDSIKNDLLTQTELNEKTLELYGLWDATLNNVWDVLKKTQDAAVMNSLTVEEREWIALKEQTVAEAGADYEGGTMQAMIKNQTAAEMTKARVYELMELFE